MARLPQPGADSGTWGDILNDYLSQTLKVDGTLKDNSVTNAAIAPGAITATEIAPNAVTATQIQDGSITETQLTTAVQVKLNATVGTPDWTTITNKPAVIAAGVDAAAARMAVGAGTSNLAIGTTGTTAKAGDYTPTKSDVGLSNVDNTSDVNKPISSATSTALAGKAASVHAHVASDISDSSSTGRAVLTAGNASAARTVIGAGTASTKTDIGLSNVDNTSDANKPVSTATQTALNTKADLVGGLVPTSQLPVIALTDVVVVASQSAMLALTALQVQPGDVVVRTDGAPSFWW